MNRTILFLFFAMVCLCSFADSQRERRVYYLDCSYSMVNPNNIWEKVCENLKNAIRKVKDERTELVVIPFTDKRKTHFPLPVYKRCATEEGKKWLISKICDFECDRHCNTIHNVPISDFCRNWSVFNGKTYMFLMTDGQNEGEIAEFENVLNCWGANYGDRNVYGFYVMLHGAAKSDKVERIIARQRHLWKVESADVDINLVSMPDSAFFNIRTEQFVDIPIYDYVNGVVFSPVINDPNGYYEITGTKISDDKSHLQVYLKLKSGHTIHSISGDDTFIEILFDKRKHEWPQTFTFLTTDKVTVCCKNRKERTLKVSVK